MLYGIHEGCAKLEHAIKLGCQWEPYIPTHFIYAFFTFNTLYNIDWDKSLNCGDLRNWHKSKTEHEKISSYIDFCCQDDCFLKDYKVFFIKYVTRKYNYSEILEELKCIEMDRRYSNGAINNTTLISNFNNACSLCLTEDVFDQEAIDTIIRFVYKIRCNLFHGVKTMEDLKYPSQQKRLEIYSSFVVAINQMVFSYLEYLKGDDITKSFDNLLERLK